MDRFIREIAITEIDGVSIGQAQDYEAKTGARVLYFKRGAQAGCDISGGDPASRETPLTDSMTADNGKTRRWGNLSVQFYAQKPQRRPA